MARYDGQSTVQQPRSAIITPKTRPPAIQQAVGKMKPGHHTKLAQNAAYRNRPQ